MTSPIDPARRVARARRAVQADSAQQTGKAEQASEAERAGLPAPVDPPHTVPPRGEPPPGAAVFDAQLLGQDGQKRGLRAGPSAIDSASASYNRIEWSGSKDRRGRKGRIAKTEI